MKSQTSNLILRNMLALLVCSVLAAAEAPRVFSMDAEALARLRKAPANSKVLESIRADADKAMKQQPLSVTSKTITPPSGDKHDYMSQAPYWWPDPTKSDGLPYIRKDGVHNPELEKLPDHAQFDKLISSVHALALGYYLLGQEKYAQHARDLLKIWFLDPETRMNPNLQFAQGIPGINTGRGIGLIETRSIGKLVDALGLLEDSKSLPPAERQALKKWFADFLAWVRDSKNGKDESAAENNHGTYYDVQVVSLALLQEDRDYARKVLEQAPARRFVKIDKEGKQPLELARTRSWGYSVMNLTGLFELARLGEVLGLDLWSSRSKGGGSLRDALDYLLPFALDQKSWTHEQIVPIDRKSLAPLLLEAARHYAEPKYRDAALRIDPEIRDNLIFALNTPEVAQPVRKTEGKSK